MFDGEVTVLMVEGDSIGNVGFIVFAGGEPDLSKVGVVEEIDRAEGCWADRQWTLTWIVPPLTLMERYKRNL